MVVVIRGTVTNSTRIIADNPSRSATGWTRLHLRVLATSDLHVNLLPYDYFADRPASHMGLARTATLVRQLRAEVANCLLLDNGDFLQGTPLADLEAQRPNGAAHPMIAAMNALGYDAANLGNHEFNFGIDYLRNAIDKADFPVVSANVMRRAAAGPPQALPFAQPYALLTRRLSDTRNDQHDLTIGIIGLAPPQITKWDAFILDDAITTEDIVAAARFQVPKLRAAGADLVIVLGHTGIGDSTHTTFMENAALPLAALPGIDALVLGHTHDVFPGPDFSASPEIDPIAGTIHGKPAVMPGHYGSHLGVIDLILCRPVKGRWKVETHNSRALPIARADPAGMVALVDSDPPIVRATSADHARALAFIRQPIGTTARPLHSYFAQVAPDSTLRLVSDAQTALVLRTLTHGLRKGLPLLSAIAPVRAGGRGGPDNYIDISAGPLVLRNASEMYQFPNLLCTLRLTGGQIADWLEQSASVFNQITPGTHGHSLLDPIRPSYNFDVIFGLGYLIDLSAPPRFDPDGRCIDPGAHRIVGLTHAGKPVRAQDQFLVVTNSYRAGGGGNFAMLADAPVVHRNPTTLRDAIIDHIRATPRIDPAPVRNWGFTPMPGTSVVFSSGPGGRAHLDAIAGLTIRDAGPDTGGFWRYAIDL